MYMEICVPSCTQNNIYGLSTLLVIILYLRLYYIYSTVSKDFKGWDTYIDADSVYVVWLFSLENHSPTVSCMENDNFKSIFYISFKMIIVSMRKTDQEDTCLLYSCRDDFVPRCTGPHQGLEKLAREPTNHHTER